jgi:hypothetical protein
MDVETNFVQRLQILEGFMAYERPIDQQHPNFISLRPFFAF